MNALDIVMTEAPSHQSVPPGRPGWVCRATLWQPVVHVRADGLLHTGEISIKISVGRWAADADDARSLALDELADELARRGGL